VTIVLVVSLASIMAGSQVFSQSYVTTATNEVYNQTIDMGGTYSSGDTNYCSITILPDSGFAVSQGDMLTGSVSATGPVSFSIVKTYQVSASGKGAGCGRLLPTQLYTRGGQSFNFQWSAPSFGTYYIALYNGGQNSIQVSLVVDQVTTTTAVSQPIQQYTTPTYPAYTSQYTPPTFTPFVSNSLTMNSGASQTGFNPYPLLEVGLIGAVLVAVFIAFVYPTMRKKAATEKTAPKALEKQSVPKLKPKPSPIVPSKLFCLECGSELPLGSKFCNKCGTRQV
jgi:hypothetical protein